MVFEARPPVELVRAFVEVVCFQVDSLNAGFSADRDSVPQGCCSDPGTPQVGPDVKLVKNGINTPKFQGKTEPDHHVTGKNTGLLEKNQTAEARLTDELVQEASRACQIKWQPLKDIEVAHER